MFKMFEWLAGNQENNMRLLQSVATLWVAGTQKIGKTLRSTELLIFGNPQGGTPLMEYAQSAGIDLPLKALAWEDAAGQVWLGYNNPQYLIARDGAKACADVAQGLRKALDGPAGAAIQ